MYGDNLKKFGKKHHTVGLLVHDEPGVLARIASLFMKRNFNITTLTVSPSSVENVSRMTVSFFGDDSVYEQMVKQLNKLIDVIKISDLPDEQSVIRELALIKIHTKSLKEQNQIMTYCQAYRTRVVNVSTSDMIVEIVGKPSKIDAFINLVKPLGIREIARTGVTALARGHGKFESL